MTTPAPRTDAQTVTDESLLVALPRQLWAAWNRRDGPAFAALFAEEGELIGFDGSHVAGRAAIAAHLGAIFAEHQTPAYVGIVRDVRVLAPDVALLRADTGLLPHGAADLQPQFNAVQVIAVVRRDGRWQIASLQNTPAQFHGRPEAVERLTNELRQRLPAAR